MATLQNRFFIEGIVLGACAVWFSAPLILRTKHMIKTHRLVQPVCCHQQPSVDYTWLRQS